MALVRKIRYFKGPVHSRAKYHISIGHHTVMATASFFGASELASVLPPPTGPLDGIVSYKCAPTAAFPWEASEFAWQPELQSAGKSAEGAAPSAPISEWQWAVLLFEAPTLCKSDGLVIGSKLDTDLTAKSCRLAFYGTVAATFESAPAAYARVCVVCILLRACVFCVFCCVRV